MLTHQMEQRVEDVRARSDELSRGGSGNVPRSTYLLDTGILLRAVDELSNQVIQLTPAPVVTNSSAPEEPDILYVLERGSKHDRDHNIDWSSARSFTVIAKNYKDAVAKANSLDATASYGWNYYYRLVKLTELRNHDRP